jgi:predicted branched-subunit amino acid permease
MQATHWQSFGQGFRALLPLWLAAAPFALAYVIAAQDAGLPPLQIQMMSLLIYSGAAQMALVQLQSADAPPVAMMLTALLLNLHHLLYGISLVRIINLTKIQRAIAAYMLTDAAYGITIAAAGANAAYLFGAEVSMFIAWNGFTALALLAGQLIQIPAAAHLDFIVPLSFFVLLLTLLKTRRDVFTALLAAGLALLCQAANVGSATLIIVGITAAGSSAWLARKDQTA